MVVGVVVVVGAGVGFVVVPLAVLVVAAGSSTKRIDWSSRIDGGKFPTFGSTQDMSELGTPIHWAKPNHTASQLVVGNIRPRPKLTSVSALSFSG